MPINLQLQHYMENISEFYCGKVIVPNSIDEFNIIYLRNLTDVRFLIHLNEKAHGLFSFDNGNAPIL